MTQSHTHLPSIETLFEEASPVKLYTLSGKKNVEKLQTLAEWADGIYKRQYEIETERTRFRDRLFPIGLGLAAASLAAMVISFAMGAALLGMGLAALAPVAGIISLIPQHDPYPLYKGDPYTPILRDLRQVQYEIGQELNEAQKAIKKEFKAKSKRSAPGSKTQSAAPELKMEP